MGDVSLFYLCKIGRGEVGGRKIGRDKVSKEREGEFGLFFVNKIRFLRFLFIGVIIYVYLKKLFWDCFFGIFLKLINRINIVLI